MISIVVGWVAGVLVNYLADVLPVKRRLVRPFCLNCLAPQAWVKTLLWPRRCPQCGKRRAWRTWVVEAVFLAGFAWLWLLGTTVPLPPSRDLSCGSEILFRSVLLIYFGVVAIIDLEHRLILHPVSLVGVGFGTVFGFWRHGLQANLFGGAVGFGSMLLLYGLGKLFAQGLSRLRKQAIEEEALGFGDVTLSGIVGLLLGWP